MTTATLPRRQLNVSRRPEENLADTRRRTIELLRTEIDFIPNPEFNAWDGDDEGIADDLLREADGQTTAPSDLPAHLRRMCDAELLTHDQETALFREMNYLKFRANAIRSHLDPDRLNPPAVAEIDTLLAKARLIRDHLIKANMRLVMSIVKKFVTPQQSFDEMLSEGILTLMQTVEKFDYDRGFRFSTYAYRSIARSSYRSVTAARKESARLTRDAEDWAFEQADPSTSSSMSDQVWGSLRELTASMLEKLDRRERFIIRSRYALGAHRKVRTFQFLADKLGVSKERVRQLEQRAVNKLRTLAGEYELDELFGASIV